MLERGVTLGVRGWRDCDLATRVDRMRQTWRARRDCQGHTLVTLRAGRQTCWARHRCGQSRRTSDARVSNSNPTEVYRPVGIRAMDQVWGRNPSLPGLLVQSLARYPLYAVPHSGYRMGVRDRLPNTRPPVRSPRPARPGRSGVPGLRAGYVLVTTLCAPHLTRHRPPNNW